MICTKQSDCAATSHFSNCTSMASTMTYTQAQVENLLATVRKAETEAAIDAVRAACSTRDELHPDISITVSEFKERVIGLFEAAATAASERTSSDTWGRWFERLGDKATAEIVNATADLVTDERLAALVDAKVLPSAAPVEQSEIDQIRARAYNSIQFSADVYMHDVRRLLRMFTSDANEGAR